ncbi:MAG: CBASS cGAMP-activated phospholipase [Planctomycetota bacterium]
MSTFQILAFDGGGIRGAFGTALIAKIEERLGGPITEYFDLVAGTSTGAILGAGLAHGLSGQRLKDFYRDHGGSIFKPREPFRPANWVRPFYPFVKYVFRRRTGGGQLDDFFRARFCPHALTSAFHEAFGESTLGQLDRSRLIVPTVNLTQGETHVFRTPHLPSAVETQSLRIVDVLLATTAAPTYFPHKVMPGGDAFCDGGLWANNPAVLAIAEAFKIRQFCTRPQCDPVYDTSSIRVLSIGTGKAMYSLSPPGPDAGALYWAPHIADVMGTSQVQGVQMPLDYLLGDRYQHINFEIPDPSWTLDNVERIPDLLKLGEEAGNAAFDRIAPRFFQSKKADDYVPFSAA